MSGKDDSRQPQRRIDDAAKATFLAALRRGERREDAAADAGFSLMGFYGARRRDPAFRAGWEAALATTPAAERRTRAYAERGQPGEMRIAPANRRLLQRRRRRHVLFTAERQAVFLAHFAATGDTRAAAAEAGVSESTVHLHRRTDPAFAELYREALASAYPRLEAQALHLGLIAQARLRHAAESYADSCPERSRRACPEPGRAGDDCGSTPCPTCGHGPGEAEAFDRAMRLLARWDRKQRRPDSKFKPGGRRQAWTFERSIVELDRALRGLGVRIEGEEN